MDFQRLHTREEILSLLEWHNGHSEFVVIDTETTDKSPRRARLVDIQISGRSEDSAVIFEAEFAELLLRIDPKIVLVGHSYKYDAHVLFRHGVDLLSRTWRDTILIGHLLDENRESYSLDSYVKEFWNDNYKEAFWQKYAAYEAAPEEEKVEYALKDVFYTDRLYRRQVEELHSQGIPLDLVQHVHRLQASLLRTEIEGLSVDLEYLQDLGIRLKSRIDELQPQMRSLVADEIEILELEAWQKEIDKRKTPKGRAAVKRPCFSFESSQQLAQLLYSRLALPAQKNEKTKAISTDYSSLEKIKPLHPVIGLIQENRELQKVYTAYVEGTLDRVDDGVIYPEFRVAGTVTGRISHSNPNLGQLPKSGGVRGIYRPVEGSVFISADYSQLEVCIEANLTEDAALKKIFVEGLSKHDITARELGVSRDAAKTLNFALQYRASHYKVAKLLSISESEAREIWEKYWNVYAGCKKLQARVDRMVERGDPIISLYGRKRRFPPGKRTQWDKDLRQAYNFLIQSPGADAMSEAFYITSEQLLDRKWGRGLLTVHDEGLIEVREEFAADAEKLLCDNMVGLSEKLNLKIPFKVESSGLMRRWED